MRTNAKVRNRLTQAALQQAFTDKAAREGWSDERLRRSLASAKGGFSEFFQVELPEVMPIAIRRDATD